MSLLISNGLAFIDGKFTKKDILVSDAGNTGPRGSIAAVSGDTGSGGLGSEATEHIDASGKLVLPGLIDPHVHLREPGYTNKEDFTTGSKAAIAGGITTVIDMPNNQIPTTTKARYEEKVALAKKKAICDVFFHFGGTDNNFDEVKATNPQFMKIYLGKTTGELMLNDPSSLEKHFTNFPKDRPIVLHTSDHDEDEEKNLERTYATTENAVNLAKKCGRKIHIAHASTKKEVQIAKGYIGCTVETAPHYLFLSRNDLARLGAYGKVYPPLRSEQKRIGLMSALEMIDCIATDHAPHTGEDKEKGAAGFPGLETSLALMFDACNRGFFDKIGIVERMSQRPAEIFGLKGRGRLQKGFIGDVTIVDPKKEWVVKGTELQTKCKWSPFEGKVLKGKVETVVKNGQVIYQENEFVK